METMTNVSAEFESTSIKLSFKQRFDFAISEYGYNIIMNWVYSFMLIYYTDSIGVPAAAVSAMVLFVRIFDAINDPIIGGWADRSKSKWGRYKPWVGIGGIFMGIFVTLLFGANPAWSSSFKVIYMWGIYVLVTVASTCCNMPYGALNGVLTSDGGERAKLSGLRMMIANMGIATIPIIAPRLIAAISGANKGPEAAYGYTVSVAICAVVGIPLLIYTAVKVKEVVKPMPGQNKLPLGLQLKTFFTNKYAVIAALGSFVFGFAAYGRGAVMAYYFTYVANNIGYMAYMGLIGLGCALIGPAFIGPFLFKKFRHKGRSMMINWGVASVFAFTLYFLRPDNFLFWVCYACFQTLMTTGMGISYSIAGDAVDYGEYKLGVRADGFVASFISLLMKAGGAIGPAIMLAIIAAQGYVPNQAQNAAVLNTFNFGISIMLGILGVAILILYAFYDLSAKKHEEILAELNQRRKDALSGSSN